MLIIFNERAFVRLGVGCLLCLPVGIWGGDDVDSLWEYAVMAIAGLTPFVWDFFGRLEEDEAGSVLGNLLHPGAGGSVFFVPVWLWPFVFAVAGLAS